MKKTRFSETKIVSIIKKQESGIPTGDICREYGISQATFYNWKAKYGGMSVKEVKRLKELETENIRLKRMYADVSMENHPEPATITQAVTHKIDRPNLINCCWLISDLL